MTSKTQEVNSDRRAFLRGAFLTREGRKTYEQQHQALGPPPPWHKGLLEIERCQGCSAPCVDACEPKIIKRHPEEHTLEGVPFLSFEETGCTFCQACATSCPMELDTTDKPAKLGQVKLDTQRCLAWSGVICISCRGHCDHGALTLDQGRRMHLDEEACTGCGRCLSVCPNTSLSIQFA